MFQIVLYLSFLLLNFTIVFSFKINWENDQKTNNTTRKLLGAFLGLFPYILYQSQTLTWSGKNKCLE